MLSWGGRGAGLTSDGWRVRDCRPEGTVCVLACWLQGPAFYVPADGACGSSDMQGCPETTCSPEMLGRTAQQRKKG